MYCCAGVYLYKDIDEHNFSTLGKSARTFLQVSTLDQWSAPYLKNKERAPGMFYFLFMYVVIQNFILLKYFYIDLVY